MAGIVLLNFVKLFAHVGFSISKGCFHTWNGRNINKNIIVTKKTPNLGHMYSI
jgi:hypothetical protein